MVCLVEGWGGGGGGALVQAGAYVDNSKWGKGHKRWDSRQQREHNILGKSYALA